MPIRFRCPHCTRLLGIARRKAGSRINCPQCAAAVSVPVPTDQNDLDLSDLAALLDPNPPGNGTSPYHPPTPDPSAQPDPEPSQPAVATEQPTAPRSKPKRKAGEETPLFEREDFDALLGVTKPAAAFDFTAGTGPKAKPVSGLDVDALSLDDGPKKIVLSPQKATLLVIAVVVLLVIAFAAGFLIAAKL